MPRLMSNMELVKILVSPGIGVSDGPFRGSLLLLPGKLNHSTTSAEEARNGSELPDREVVSGEKEFYQGDGVPLEDVLPFGGPTSYVEVSLGASQNTLPLLLPQWGPLLRGLLN